MKVTRLPIHCVFGFAWFAWVFIMAYAIINLNLDWAWKISKALNLADKRTKRWNRINRIGSIMLLFSAILLLIVLLILPQPAPLFE